MAKRPWRSHYTRDWAIDPFVRSLELEPRMVYLELLDIAWDEDGLRLDWLVTGEYVAKRIGISRRKFLAIWDQIRFKFEEFSPGNWSNSRLEIERITADKFSEKQSNSAKHKHLKHAAALPGGSGLALPSQSQSHTQSHLDPSGGSSPATQPEQSSFKLAPPEQATSNKPTAPDVAEAVTHYQRRWVQVRKPDDGVPPTLQKADRGQLIAMLKAYGLEGWKQHLESYLADPDRLLAANGWPLRLMPQRVDGYRAKRAGPSHVGHAKPAPHNTETTEYEL